MAASLARAGQFRGVAVASRAGPKMTYGFISSGSAERIAINAIAANERFNRDVSVKAATGAVEKAKEAREWINAYKANMNPTPGVPMIDQVKAVVEDMGMAGVTAPMGFFDPLGFTSEVVFNESGTFGVPVSKGKLLFYREVELKHGRVGMLAALGILVGEKFHPLFGGDIDVPSYVAFQQTPLQSFWPAVVAAIAVPEMYSVFSFNRPGEGELWTIQDTHQSGNLGWDPLGLKPKDAAGFKEMQNKELNNGRLAMLAAAGMIAQELVTQGKLF
jgi:hypothetical protein